MAQTGWFAGRWGGRPRPNGDCRPHSDHVGSNPVRSEVRGTLDGLIPPCVSRLGAGRSRFMSVLARLVALSFLCLAAPACGPAIDAVVSGGPVTLQPPEAETAVATGPIAFVRRTTLTAGHAADTASDTRSPVERPVGAGHARSG